ncbi:hypothetical protein BAU28_07085 [Bacillus paramycoides]|uniref:Integrase n=1 Tax=Bacillus paramycoides TaxID=2026194 RepID=A0A1J9VCE3_9BACI|nr:hypothetical protein BAU28_07085 [Bacillus paramycoides]
MYDFGFQQAYDYFYQRKSQKDYVKKRLLATKNTFAFFLKWVSAYHPELKKASEVNTHLIRKYMVYMIVVYAEKRSDR